MARQAATLVTRKRRRVGDFSRLLLVLIGVLLIMAGAEAVFAPWSFFLGGHFHVVPLWQGAGIMHTSSGDYALSFWIAPSPPGRTFDFPYFTGWGSLCTPRGERYRLRVSGGLHEHAGIDLNGKAMHLTLYSRPWNYNLTGNPDDRPHLDLRGAWRNPDLVLEDGGTLSQSFLPDGTLNTGRRNPPPRETVSIVVHETSWFGWSSDCRSAKP
jgi:hypothetical protein